MEMQPTSLRNAGTWNLAAAVIAVAAAMIVPSKVAGISIKDDRRTIFPPENK